MKKQYFLSFPRKRESMLQCYCSADVDSRLRGSDGLSRIIALMIVAIIPLAGCGNTQMDRALSGAGIGAGAGAVTGVLVGGSVGGAMLLGAGAGAVAGAVTDKSRINFGDPIWR